MDLPNWADEVLSRELAVLRARGENQDLEYMREFPTQARELAKEIAAFATSNPGIILVGVSREGDLVGVDDADTADGRDRLIRRVEGLCRGTVRPAITPSVTFAVEDAKAVLVIRVPKGGQPVYYCNSVPYVRHVTESRPAEPHEVLELVIEWQSRRGGITAAVPIGDARTREEETQSAHLSELNAVLIELLLFGSQVESRSINPALDALMSTFGYGASRLRELAATDEADQLGLRSTLSELAKEADRVAFYRHTLGPESWREFVLHVQTVVDEAEALKAARLDSLPIDPHIMWLQAVTVSHSAHELRELGQRADEMIEQGRLYEIQAEASQIGHSLLQASHFGLSRCSPERVRRLRALGERLHLLETLHFTMGGGEIAELLEAIRKGAEEAKTLGSEFETEVREAS